MKKRKAGIFVDVKTMAMTAVDYVQCYSLLTSLSGHPGNAASPSEHINHLHMAAKSEDRWI